MWLRIIHSGEWCLRLVLRTHSGPIQYEHAPLRVRCAMLRKHPPVDPVLSCLSCFRKPSVGVCQVVSNSPDPGIAWPSTRFPPDLWRWFEEDTASGGACQKWMNEWRTYHQQSTNLVMTKYSFAAKLPLCLGCTNIERIELDCLTLMHRCRWRHRVVQNRTTRWQNTYSITEITLHSAFVMKPTSAC